MSFLFVAGFDFGTSYSKVVIQDQRSSLKKVIIFDNEHGALFPSFLRIGEGWISGPEGNYEGLVVPYPKLVAADAASRESIFRSITSENYAEAKEYLGISDAKIFAKALLIRYFLSVIQGIHHFLKNDDEWHSFDPAVDPLVIQIAVPTGLLQRKDQEVETLMVESLMAATLLNDNSDHYKDYSNTVELIGAIESLNSLPAGQRTKLGQRCIAYPEVAAGVQPILQSKAVRDAKFVTLDVGAGTIDLNVFHRWTRSGKKTLDYWACQVKPLGFARLPVAGRRSNRGEHEISVNAIPQKSLMKKVHSAVLALMKEAFVYQPFESAGDGPSPWTGETLAYIWGGGSEYSPYQETLRAALSTFDIGVHDINRLPKPSTDLEIPPGIQFGRLAIAFGLSYYYPNLKKIRLPSALKSYAETYGIGLTEANPARPRQDQQLFEGEECSCCGMNPACPNCFGSGTIRKSQKPVANLEVLRKTAEKRKAIRKNSPRKTAQKKMPKTQKTSSKGTKNSSSSGEKNLSAPKSLKGYSEEQLLLLGMLDDFRALPKTIPFARRIRALNMIRSKYFPIKGAKDLRVIKTVDDFLSQQVGQQGNLVICSGSAKKFYSGCDVMARVTNQQDYEVRVLHKKPEQLLEALNNLDAPAFQQLRCQIMKDRTNGSFILRSIPPRQIPTPA